MMFRNTATACLLFLLALDSAMAQTPLPSFTIPVGTIRSKVASNKISNTIHHTTFGTGIYSIGIRYYLPGCQGTALTPAGISPILDSLVDTAAVSGLLSSSTISNSLEDLRKFSPTTGGTPFFGLKSGSPAQNQYRYCVEFLLKDGNDQIVDQERYDVSFDASLNGEVTTSTTVITEVVSGADPTTFTAKVIVCDPATGGLVTKNFFKGDSITFCFTSNDFPAASITGLTLLTASVTNDDPLTETTVTIKNALALVTLGADVTGFGCTGTVQTCRYTVQLGGATPVGATPVGALDGLFLAPATTSTRPVTVKGTLAMTFGTTRRNVRVLFQNDSFPRNAETTFAVSPSEETKTDNTCKCSGLFFIICWFFKCFLGWFK